MAEFFWIKVLGKCSLYLWCFTCYATINVEHARTPEEIAWGLMQRVELPENHGMLFYYDPPEVVQFWMFNVLIDLSVAFMDADFVVQEIHELKAYPEMMKRLPKIYNVHQLRRVSPSHSVVKFFHDRGVKSSFPISYALEMPAGWFKRRNVQVGSSLRELLSQKQAF